MASEVNETQPSSAPSATPWKQDFLGKFGYGSKGEAITPEAPPEASRSVFQRVWDMHTPKQYKLPTEGSKAPPGDFESLFDKVLKQESGKRHRDDKGNLITSRVGAQGISQVMPKTGKSPGYGVAPLADDSENEYIRFGKDLLKAYTNEFGGDVRKGLAAYNAGPKRVGDLVKDHGANWETKLPAETKKYLKKILKD